ncbi:hypothetical protein SERLA73DRAFT_180538 [Serpula lacrymans var. lacrymans S7.3]|uniref:VanZ-like domain-containing protein n=2 Tax=Serpula lacrymans var. lacrymans TaxID=341189 RepID=F8PV25_SERL3|nr:uncharacterized protein SERLADRAFT_466183 [Serpula lacrymans var. lacrymans S7.9]EGO00105.1 hypothetical protein SERLA73DRAFT_180538 [Serpula lacrymans var. lacrymans S7.3]EGO25665.1 hypothetical protein SERLADRAFT_466183 [Serpula lacrymans var. lacrymans S7.9]
MPVSLSPSQPRSAKKSLKRVSKAIMKSYRVRIPKYDLPIRLRPWFIFFTCAIMVILAFLSFTNVSRSLPLNDKLLHFICFCIATGVFYFIFDVEEDARRIWFWRHSGLLFTAVICFFFGGLVSEIVQSMLPYKEFHFGDVVANMLGSTIGLYIAYYVERYYRHRREIARLYRPLDTESVLSDDEDLSEDGSGQGTQLLPTHYVTSPIGQGKHSASTKGKAYKADRLADVWDEREELFGIGDDSDVEDNSGSSGAPSHKTTHVRFEQPPPRNTPSNS